MSEEKKKEEIKKRFIKRRGYWSEDLWGKILEWDPGFMERYLDFSAHPWVKGVLDPEIRELIYIAIDASTTHLYKPGLRQHIKNALEQGAALEEILEVLELVSVLGIHSITEGVPILADELKKMESKE